MESVFNISNCTAACQVKYAACTLQGVALTWWNSHVKTVNLEVAQALPWKTLKKMMTDKVEKYIGGLLDTIHDSIKAARPKTMQEAIEFATKLMDKMICDILDINSLKRASESQGEKAAKRQKLNEEVAELKRRLQIVPNNDDDVYTEATPLARKVPVVAYEIYT
nr:hypothetical protein [Tanacetum cinerariifolium]